MIALNMATPAKAKFCSQMFRSFDGHFSLSPSKLPTRRDTKAPRWVHSPTAGMGQVVHQKRAPNGIRAMIRRAHQTIQTKMIEKLALPTDVPNSPVRITTTKKKRLTDIATH